VINRSRHTSPFNRQTQYDTKRRAILDQAARLINHMGSGAATLHNVADRLGLTKTSLYHYVKTKQDLVYECFLAALEHHHHAISEMERRYTSPLEQLSGYIRWHFEDIVQAHRTGCGHYVVLLEIDTLKGGQREKIAAGYIRLFKRLRAFIRRGESMGMIRTRESNATTRAILGAIEWAYYWLREVPEELAEQAGDATLDIFLHGLFNGDALYTYQPREPGSFQAPPAEFDRKRQNRMKREAFARAGTRFFNRKGYNSTALEEIAEQLNVSKGAFYYHIRNKQELLYLCFEYTLDILDEIHREALDRTEYTGIQRVEQVCHRIFLSQNGEAGPLIGYNTVTALSLPLRRKVLARTEEVRRMFGAIIASGIEDGSIRPVNPVIAQHLFAGLGNASMDIHQWRRVNDVEDAAADYFDIFFNGILPRNRVCAPA